jgi:GNAT superfamily N-acetyltransferase
MTALHLARGDDLERVLPLVAAFHQERALPLDEPACRAGLGPLLEGVPHGVVYLIGPARAPIGYVIISFGWSVTLGGMEGTVKEIFIRPGVRGRGIGSEILKELAKALGQAGLTALHVDLPRDDDRSLRFYTKLRFAPGPDHLRLTLSH